MDIDISDEILERMLARVRRLTPEEALNRLQSHKLKSIGARDRSFEFSEIDLVKIPDSVNEADQFVEWVKSGE